MSLDSELIKKEIIQVVLTQWHDKSRIFSTGGQRESQRCLKYKGDVTHHCWLEEEMWVPQGTERSPWPTASIETGSSVLQPQGTEF